MITCKFCGNENNDNATLCYICGKSLTAGRTNSLVGMGEDQEYHAVNGNLPYGTSMETAAKFQSDTGGGAHSGPTQQTFGAQMMAGQTDAKKKGGISGGTIAAIIILLAVAAAIWYFCFSPYAVIHF